MGTEEEPRIGVFVCHCGHNIAGTVDVESVARVAQHYPHVAYSVDLMFTCSDAGQAHIREKIGEHIYESIALGVMLANLRELPRKPKTLSEWLWLELLYWNP